MSANDTSQSAYARVFSATGSEPLSAKSIATATGLPYKQVTAELARLLEQGQVEQHKDGTRTLWTRAAHVPAGHVPDEPLSADETERLSDMHAAADERAAAVEGSRVDAAIAALDNQPLESLKRDALVSLCRDLGVSTNPRDTKAALIERAAQRIAERKQALRDAARPDFAGMKVAELREQAKALGVAGTVSKMPRAELITACDAAWDVQQDAADAPAVETPAPAAESDVETLPVPDGPWGTPAATDAPSGSVDAVLAELQAARPVSAPPAHAAPRRASGRPAGGVVSSGAAPAWQRGQCEATLLAMMQALPDVEHSATSLVKTYNERRADGQPIMQPGSTAFALDAMVRKGTARLTQDKPKRYAAAVVPIPSA